MRFRFHHRGRTPGVGYAVFRKDATRNLLLFFDAAKQKPYGIQSCGHGF